MVDEEEAGVGEEKDEWIIIVVGNIYRSPNAFFSGKFELDEYHLDGTSTRSWLSYSKKEGGDEE